MSQTTSRWAILAICSMTPLWVLAEPSAGNPPGPGPAVTASVPTAEATAAPEAWAIHGQMTNVSQHHPRFRSLYAGTNSLTAAGRTEETTDVTLFAGLRPWRGAEIWVNPEFDQGFGLSNTVGAAGFPSGEAYKIGANTPYFRLPRAFLRQTVDLGHGEEQVDGAANQLAGTGSADKLVLTVGKFSATDIFDTNTFAHDPRSDFLNWSVIDAGTFDYAADPWGFTFGGTAEWSDGPWTWRGGFFQLSKEPNGKVAGIHFSQYMVVAEAERRHEWWGLAGKVKLLGFANRGRMAAYDDAVHLSQATGDPPDPALVRRQSSRPGVTLNVEQILGAHLGGFVRLGVNDGSKEAYEFTEINNSASAGLSFKGDAWGRVTDVFGVAGVSNGLSAAARRYFAAGGIGILIGDGALTYAREEIVEAFYAWRPMSHLSLTFDVQRIVHPAYNKDRGPVSVFALRAHAEF